MVALENANGLFELSLAANAVIIFLIVRYRETREAVLEHLLSDINKFVAFDESGRQERKYFIKCTVGNVYGYRFAYWAYFGLSALSIAGSVSFRAKMPRQYEMLWFCPLMDSTFGIVA
jgi:hypothetical protein